MTVERVRVGNVLALRRREVTIEPLAEYRLVGVYSFGKGIFHREAQAGAELGDYRFFSIEPGDLVLSNIQAWEGAIAYAEQRDAGTIGTHRFLSYVPVGDQIDTNWARWFFLSEPGMELIRQAAPGIVMRNRTLAIERFEALEIPLPPIDDQRRIARDIECLVEGLSETTRRAARAAILTARLIDGSAKTMIWDPCWPLHPLGEIAEVNPRPAGLDTSEEVLFVPMAAVAAATGAITDASTKTAGEVGPGYKQFRRGDVIFARITPCMQNGKSAIYTGTSEYAYGSTEFHVVRPGPETAAVWLHCVMRTREFRNMAAERFTGTAGQQRVPAAFLNSVPIPVPPIEKQIELVAGVDRIAETGRLVAERRHTTATLTAALLPSALNQVFSGLR